MVPLSDWAHAFLHERRHATLGTLDGDGTVHLTPVWYVFADDQLFVGSSSSSRKVKNVIARPTATLVVDLRQPGIERWVSGSGPVTVLRGAESQRINAAIQERYLTAEALRDPRVGPPLAAGDDVTIAIRPVKWRSWAAGDLDAQFFGGLLTATPERWFRRLD